MLAFISLLVYVVTTHYIENVSQSVDYRLTSTLGVHFSAKSEITTKASSIGQKFCSSV